MCSQITSYKCIRLHCIQMELDGDSFRMCFIWPFKPYTQSYGALSIIKRVVSFGDTKHTPRPHPDPEPHGSQWGFHSASPMDPCCEDGVNHVETCVTIHPDHTQTLSPMEPPGVSFGHDKITHIPGPHPQPQVDGSFSWRYKLYTQTARRPEPYGAPW